MGAVTPELVQSVAEVVAREGACDATVKRLRERHPGVAFSLCSDDDVVTPRPVHETPNCNFYLLGGGEHCPSLTTDYETAVGIVLAVVE